MRVVRGVVYMTKSSGPRTEPWGHRRRFRTAVETTFARINRALLRGCGTVARKLAGWLIADRRWRFIVALRAFRAAIRVNCNSVLRTIEADDILLSCHLGRMNRRRFCLQKGGCQEHNSLITVMFCFNELAVSVWVKHKINSRPTQILGFILICLYFTTVYFAKNVAYFPFNSWLSFQRLCRLL